MQEKEKKEKKGEKVMRLHLECHFCLVRREKGTLKSVPPVDAESRARNLNDAIGRGKRET